MTDDGSIFVSDGYGDTKCHRFDAAGRHELTWGEPGNGPGQFALPHGIWVLEDGRVLVADRENDRIQVFDRDGVYITEWGNIPLPSDFYVDEDRGAIFVSELNRGIAIFDFDGKVITRWAQERRAVGSDRRTARHLGRRPGRDIRGRSRRRQLPAQVGAGALAPGPPRTRGLDVRR